MDYITNYYKNKCEKLKNSIHKLNNQKKLFEAFRPELMDPVTAAGYSNNNTETTINPGNFSWWRFILKWLGRNHPPEDLFNRNFIPPEVMTGAGNPNVFKGNMHLGDILVQPIKRKKLFGQPDAKWLRLKYDPPTNFVEQREWMWKLFNDERRKQGLPEVSYKDFWDPKNWDIPKHPDYSKIFKKPGISTPESENKEFYIRKMYGERFFD